jgi:hypothetical protein
LQAFLYKSRLLHNPSPSSFCILIAIYYVHSIVKSAKPRTTYKEICEIDEDTLFELLFPKGEKPSSKPLPDFLCLHREMKKKWVTLQLLYEEYKRDNPDRYERTQLYCLYRDWIKKADPVMRINHKAGEKMLVAFSGDKPHYQDPAN